MASFVFIIGIPFCLYFVSYPCEGKITIVNGEGTRYAEPGENVIIEWRFDQDSADLFSRKWKVIKNKIVLIAYIYGDGAVNLEPSNLQFEVKKPATLILKNVNDSNSGTYIFEIAPLSSSEEMSSVRFSIAVKPSVTINCCSPTIVNEGNDVRCLCESEGGNPPTNVTWYDEDGKQIGVAGDGHKMLTLSKIDKTANGTYKCVARSHKLKDEKLIEVFVNQKATYSASKGGTDWYIIVVTLIAGVIIGILVSCIFVSSRHRFQNRKPQSKPVPESSKTVNSIYQDLDLSKMNSEDNYQSLIVVDSGRNDADYENGSDSAYTELNKVRDVENNYQSLS